MDSVRASSDFSITRVYFGQNDVLLKSSLDIQPINVLDAADQIPMLLEAVRQNYFLAGMTAVATGLFATQPRLEDDKISEADQKIGGLLILAGFGLIASPFASAYLSAKTDDPN